MPILYSIYNKIVYGNWAKITQFNENVMVSVNKCEDRDTANIHPL